MRNSAAASRLASSVTRALIPACIAFFVLAGAAQASPLVVVGEDGVRVVEDPALPPAEQTDLPYGPGGECTPPPPPVTPAPPAPRSAATGVRRTLAAALRSRRITKAEHDAWRADYNSATSTRARESGRSRRELTSVIATVERIAARGALTPSRMPALFLQLRRNTEFWGGTPRFPPREDLQTTPGPCGGGGGGSSNPNGSRVSFEGSPLVFQYYAGSGLQIQPLANWGKVNALYTNCRRAVRSPGRYTCDQDQLRLLLDELIGIASQRGSFLTWEYWFTFGGGAPPWTSGLSQGTAIQALARAYLLLRDPRYLSVARRAVGAFSTSAPVGVRARGQGGNHYLIYSFAPGLRVLNGFMQALTGLYDYADVAGDRRALSLFRSGDRAARREIPDYDTGSWSRYSLGGAEATLGYHRLVIGFLRNLCQRTKRSHYCRAMERFRTYLGKPPAMTIAPTTGAAGTPLRIRFSLSKRACVVVSVRFGGEKVFEGGGNFNGGTRSVVFTPEQPGTYEVILRATDERLNKTTVTGTIEVG
jgi:D-glucuronyl C5-epimerase C-terminus